MNYPQTQLAPQNFFTQQINNRELSGSVPGEVLVKFRSESAMERAMRASRAVADSQIVQSSASGIEAILARHSVKETVPLLRPSQRQKGRLSAQAQESLNSMGRIVRMVSATKSHEETYALMIELSRQPKVEYAEPNLIYELDMVPNDPFYSSSGTWGQNYSDMWGLRNIQAEQAWDVSQGEGVVVAVVDTGLDYKHPDIKKNIWNNAGETGKDSSGRDKKSNKVDDDGNGYVDDWRGWDFPDHRFGDIEDKNPVRADNNPMDTVTP